MDLKKALKFMAVAEAMESMSKDPSTKVGAVAINEDFSVVSLGYNGFPRGVADSPARYEERDLKLKLAIHAEANLVTQAARNGASLNGSTVLVSSLFPCSICAGLLVQAGVKRVIAPPVEVERWLEDNRLAQLVFEEADVQVVTLDDTLLSSIENGARIEV